MSVRSIEVLQRYLRRLSEEGGPSEDAVLLHRFVTAKDREAFELLIARHGPMVLGTARRLVDNTHDAEDVFQAVFLSLARLAKSIRQGRTLPAWLHKTTCRIAAKVRKDRGSGPQEPSPEPCEDSDPAAHLVWQEVRQALDEELQRLPERLRSPLLLCYLSGLTRDEAARQLGWSLGTLKRRLEEGRKVLRVRLERRGIAAVGLALAVLTPEALQAAVSKSLLDSSLSLIFSKAAVVPHPDGGHRQVYCQESPEPWFEDFGRGHQDRLMFVGDGDEHGAVLAVGVARTPRGTRLLARESLFPDWPQRWRTIRLGVPAGSHQILQSV
jgi:RNA polymerase sigma factor (sigma-70 family)